MKTEFTSLDLERVGNAIAAVVALVMLVRVQRTKWWTYSTRMRFLIMGLGSLLLALAFGSVEMAFFTTEYRVPIYSAALFFVIVALSMPSDIHTDDHDHGGR